MNFVDGVLFLLQVLPHADCEGGHVKVPSSHYQSAWDEKLISSGEVPEFPEEAQHKQPPQRRHPDNRRNQKRSIYPIFPFKPNPVRK